MNRNMFPLRLVTLAVFNQFMYRKAGFFHVTVGKTLFLFFCGVFVVITSTAVGENRRNWCHSVTKVFNLEFSLLVKSNNAVSV